MFVKTQMMCGLTVLATVALGSELAQAAAVNLFDATTAPGGIYVGADNGASWPGNAVSSGTANYPSELGSTPSVVDGNPTTYWLGNSQGGDNLGLNLGIVAGHYTDNTASTFVQNTFGQIATIRIWSYQWSYAYPDTSTYWQQYPGALKVVYATGNGGWTNAYTFGSASSPNNPDLATGGFWNATTITAINGSTPTLISDQTNYPGYVALGASAFVNGGTTVDMGNDGVHGEEYANYADVSVAIPAGATAVVLEFGAMDYNGGGANIDVNDVQAFAPVPEPASLALLAAGGLLLLLMRRRA